MPFCTQCGNQVAPADQFCGRCGAAQPQFAARPTPSSAPKLEQMSPRTAAVLCYVPFVGWIAAIVLLASERFRNNSKVRFHAFQGLYLFVAWLIIEWVVSPVLWIGPWFGWGFPRLLEALLKLSVLGAWIFMLVKVSQEEDFRLPVLGELADRSVSEQRP